MTKNEAKRNEVTAQATQPKQDDALSLREVAGPTPMRAEASVPESASAVTRSLLASEFDYRIAVAQISTDPGAIKENTAKIIDYITEAKRKGARLVVFPELAIPGYCAMDLLFNKSYLQENIAALQQIRAATAGITAIVGFVDCDFTKTRSGGRPMLYNSAAIIKDGVIVGVQDKTLLPNYNIFFEDRYFAPPRASTLVNVDGKKIGTEICEDLWAEGYSLKPTDDLIKAGADLIVNISASPFHLGKLPVRNELISKTTKGAGVPFVYANLVGGFDGFEGEVLFDGRSMVYAPDGSLLGMGKGFKEDLLIVDLVDKQKLELPPVPEVEELFQALVLGIKDYFRRIGDVKRANFKCAIIGLSGGIDSALVAALAVEALGPDKVLGITMPSKHSSGETKGDAYQLAENLGIKCKTISIESEYAAIEKAVRSDAEVKDLPDDVAEENIQARLRMLNLMYFANKLKGLVLNTGNKTELALDNCTLYGDMVGGFSVLGDVDKDRVYALSRYINQRAGKELIPLTTIERAPSAELKPNQTDDMVMGAMPQVIAPLVRAMVEEGLTLTDALARFGDKFEARVIERAFMLLDRSEYKRRQAAPAIRVTPVAFGNGRRIPMNHGYRG